MFRHFKCKDFFQCEANFVIVQRCDPTADDPRTLVQAVEFHVPPGTRLEFKINDETAHFGFLLAIPASVCSYK